MGKISFIGTLTLKWIQDNLNLIAIDFNKIINKDYSKDKASLEKLKNKYKINK